MRNGETEKRTGWIAQEVAKKDVFGVCKGVYIWYDAAIDFHSTRWILEASGG